MLTERELTTPRGVKLNLWLETEGAPRPLVVICPGGGYEYVSPREGAPVARAYAAQGLQAAVVHYTVSGSELGFTPLYDLADAVGTLRDKASELNLDPERIAAAGFSAGGHLAALLGALGSDERLFTKEEQRRCRVSALVLCYPVISAGRYAHQGSFLRLCADKAKWEQFSIEKHVTAKFPPSFIWHTEEDGAVPVENSLALAQELISRRIPCELHIYTWGEHGLSLATPEVSDPAKPLRKADAHTATWLNLSAQWLKRILS